MTVDRQKPRRGHYFHLSVALEKASKVTPGSGVHSKHNLPFLFVLELSSLKQLHSMHAESAFSATASHDKLQ